MAESLQNMVLQRLLSDKHVFMVNDILKVFYAKYFSKHNRCGNGYLDIG